MDKEFVRILAKFAATGDKEALALELCKALEIDKTDLSDRVLLQTLIGRNLTEVEWYKLDILNRAVNYNPEVFGDGLGGGEEAEMAEE